ncbi:MAG: CDP-2,3-bis-(O-geranylgeranyl)-sn-glycerol synthase [Candidatus Aenigmatarchaeota archaeon]
MYEIIEAIWLILPAYAANGLAPFVKFLPNRHAIDSGYKLGKMPLFGQTKTWEGFLLGVFFACLVSFIQYLAKPFLPFHLAPQPLLIVEMTPLLGLVIGAGAMCGDLFGSFIKRRIGIKSGSPLPLLDQLDFLAGSLFLSSFFVSIKLEWIVWLAILTTLLHYTASFIGFKLGIKNQPW